MICTAAAQIGDMAFSVVARGVWNRLPTKLKLACLTASFKRTLKSVFSSVQHIINSTSLMTMECVLALIV